MGLRLTLDEGFDALATDTIRTMPFRLFLTGVTGALMAANLGWRIGGPWLAVALALDIWSFSINRDPPAAPSRGLRIARLIGTVIMSAVWTTAAALYWRTGERAFQIVAIAQLGSLMVVSQSLSFQSLLGSLAIGALPAIALFVLPVLMGGFGGLQIFTLVLVTALTLVYVANDARDNARHAGALRDAQAALEARQIEVEAERERAIAANRAKSAFLAMMSHELRTPMNGVLGMAHAMSQTRLDPQQAEHMDMLIRSGEGLMTILGDILDISKIEAGRLELETIAFDLHELGERVRDLWAAPAATKGLALAYDLDPAAPRWLMGDPTRLQQILTNLVSNAVKFTAEGEVRLMVRALGEGGGKARIELKVSDTGIGMSDEQRAKVFESFTQADISTTRRFGGTGLGLSICKDLASLMGGEIVVESQAGQGSTFGVTVELATAEAPAPAKASPEASDIAGRRVLVADDHPINQAVARSILEAAGAEVTCAGDGAEALRLLAADAFDAVLMDVHMPRMDGLEALRRLRAGEGGRPETPVIALTADAMAGVDDELMAHGFDAVEPKPIRPAHLIGAIALACAGGQPARIAAA
jgi:signal transduction histidine kinase/CheY-like chemotaxis protein